MQLRPGGACPDRQPSIPDSDPDSDQTKALRALTRAREDLVRTRVGLANPLRDQLPCFWPGASKVAVDASSRLPMQIGDPATFLAGPALGDKRVSEPALAPGSTAGPPRHGRLANGGPG